MIRHPLRRLEQIGPEECEAIHGTALRILERVGLVLQSEAACRAVREIGATVDEHDRRVRFPAHVVEKAVAIAPRRFTLYGRSPARAVELGTDALLVFPGYGSASVADPKGVRRPATMADFRAFASLAWRSDCIDITGGLLVEPLDVPPALRPLELTYALMSFSDKPFFGSAAGAQGARESLALARIAFPDAEHRPVMLGLVNVNSPLRLDAIMAGALVEYARAAQPVLLTPGIMMGVTAPVTTSGALAQAFAELLGCVAVVQAIRPGAPVMIGTGGFGSDLRSGGPGFGRPENALGTLIGAQLARRVGLPFRCSGAVTGSRLPDCRSGYERMMTAMAAWSAGAHLCLQGAGTLDSIASMSFEQFALDVEIWGYVKRLASRPGTDPASLALDVVTSLPEDYLALEHTVDNLRHELHVPTLAPPWPYEEWVAAGAPDATVLAGRGRQGAVPSDEMPPMDESLRRELAGFVRRRREELS